MPSSPKNSSSEFPLSSPSQSLPPSKESPPILEDESPAPPKEASPPSSAPAQITSPPPSSFLSPPSPKIQPPSQNMPKENIPPPPPPKLISSHKKELTYDNNRPLSTHNFSKDGNPNSDHSDIGYIRSGDMAGVVTAGALLFIFLIVICITCIKRKRKHQMQYYAKHSQGHKVGTNPQSPLMANKGEMSSNFSEPHRSANPPSPNLALGFNKSTFTYDELEAATNGFSRDNLLGQGGFGYVFRGVLPNDKVVAVKSLKSGSVQGEREFQAEVDIISRVHHRHLVSLVGYCIDGEQRMLVYEFVPNKTLDFHLHVNGGVTLNSSRRLVIAIGAAKGLAYLHEDCHPRIIHRDIKASNILLDNNYEAMVADFGLAKLTAESKSHVSTRIMGTVGYLAPEYASNGQLTDKSDVFSYGVMLVELITGRKAVHMGDNLTDWARPILIRALGDNNYDELVDPHLHNEYNHPEMARMITCASASIRETAKRRPRMSQIVRVLEGDVSIETLNEDPDKAPVVT